MVIKENVELEKEVLSGRSCFAVPVEAFVSDENEPVICAYSFCIDAATEWERLYGDELLSDESLKWLEKELSAVVESLGYARVSNENEMMLEYVYDGSMQAPKYTGNIKVHKISSNAVLQKLCEASGCDIEINDDMEDIIFAVVVDGKLCAYAGMNDLIYDDNSVEISVETAPEHRRKGYGDACVSALVKHLFEKGKTVRYKCSESNAASSALAEKCGFTLEGKRFSFVCEKI